MDIWKLGKKIPFFGRRALEDFLNLSPDEFLAISCGKHSTPDVKYLKIKGREYFKLSGKFSPTCEECEELYIHGMEYLQHFWRVCRDDWS